MIAVIAEFCPRLRHTNIVPEISCQSLIALSRGCPDLRDFETYNPFISDESILSLVEHCHQLETITFHDNIQISSEPLSALLRVNPCLTSVTLYHCPRVDNEAILALAQHCPKLESLYLESFLITEGSSPSNPALCS